MDELYLRYLKKLQFRFRITYGSLLLFFLLFSIPGLKDSPLSGLLFIPLVIAVIFSWMYIFFLAKMVNLFNKSIIVWIGLSLIFSPIGLIVAHFEMSRLIEEQIKEIPKVDETKHQDSVETSTYEAITTSTYEADDLYKQLVSQNPDDADAHNKLGVAFLKLNRYQDAIKAYKHAIKR